MPPPLVRVAGTTTREAIAAAALVVFAWAILLVTGLRLFADTGWPAERAAASASTAMLLVGLAALAAVRAGWRLAAGGAAVLGATGLAFVDALAWRRYEDVLSVGDWPTASNLSVLPASAGAILTPQDAWVLGPLVIGVLACLRRISGPSPRRSAPKTALATTVLALAAAVPAADLVVRDPEGLFEFAFQRRELVSALGLPGYHAYDMLDHVRQTMREWRASTAIDVDGLPGNRFRRHRLTGAAAGANVILVSLESFQQFVIDLEVDGQPVAPRLSALSRESLRWTRAIDQTHRATTADAEWLALQSLYPLAAGAVATRRGSIGLHALPAILAEEGYTTRSAAAEPPGYWNMGRFHRRLGFGASWFADSFAAMPWIGIGGADARFFEVMAERLTELQEPYLAYLLTSSSHHPFDLPAAERRLQLASLEGSVLGAYLHSVHYTDRALGTLLDELRHSGHLDRSLLVVYGDHTAALPLTPAEQAVALGTSPALAGADPAFVRWWLRARVPLLMRLPSAHAAGEIDRPAGLVDLAPTVLGLLGIPADAFPLMGRDLLDETGEGVVVTRAGGIADGDRVMLPGDRQAGFTWNGRAAACDRLDSRLGEARRVFQWSDALIAADGVAELARTARHRASRRQPRNTPVLVIAHRGDSANYPENTALAMRSALDRGADLVEADVRLTRDGHAVIFHDEDLSRLTGRGGRVEDLTIDEFRKLDVGSWMKPDFRGTPPLTLVDLLELAKGRGGVLLDLKADGLGAPVADAVARTAFSRRAVLIGAWTTAQRREFRRQLPGTRLLRTEGPPADLTGRAWREARREGAWGWEFDAAAPDEFLAAVSRSGLVPIAYTVNDEPTMRRLIDAGVGGIETDDPGTLRRIVDQLGVGTRVESAVSVRW